MTSGKSNLVDVTLEKRMEKGAGIAFFQGELDKDDKEIWIWLPKSQIEIEEGQGKACTVTLPEWLAKDKGLI